MPLTRDSPCVGNLLEDSESELKALMLTSASLLIPSSDFKQAQLLLGYLPSAFDASKCLLWAR